HKLDLRASERFAEFAQTAFTRNTLWRHNHFLLVCRQRGFQQTEIFSTWKSVSSRLVICMEVPGFFFLKKLHENCRARLLFIVIFLCESGPKYPVLVLH
ncbi:hypothetical protein NDU88_001126, partial [Pleurodeles waltl]